MGKYEAVLPGLERSPSTNPDPTRQEEIEQVKRTTADRSPEHLARRYARLRLGDGPRPSAAESISLMMRLGKDGLKELLSLLEVQVEAYEQMICDSFDRKDDGWGQYGAGENMVRMPDGSTVRIDVLPEGKVVDREAFRRWCVANGYERQLQLHSGTMNSIVCERLLAGEDVPDGVEAKSWQKVVFTKAKR